MHKPKVLFLLVLVSSVLDVSSQNRMLPVKRMRIGEEYPNLPLLKTVNSTDSKKQIEDYRGKPLVLDFWATWCAPCVESFSKIDSFQNEFKNQLEILPITTQSEKVTLDFFKNLRRHTGLLEFKSVVDDSMHTRTSGHRVIPHLIWIDPNGIVQAITGHSDLTRENIKSFIRDNKFPFTLKDDLRLKVDLDKPFLNTEIYSPKDLTLYHSIITKYRQDLPGGSFANENRITCPNSRIIMLYAVAFGEFMPEYFNSNRQLVRGAKNLKDSLFLGVFTQQTKKDWDQIKHLNKYTYELLLDSSFTWKEKFRIMQTDLNRYFNAKGINGKIEKHKRQVLALVMTQSENKINSKGGIPKDIYTPFSIEIQNLPMMRFISKFQSYFYKRGSLPIIDETDYKGNIDISIKCDLTDIDAVNRELIKYNLKLQQKEQEIDMIVVELNYEKKQE